MLKILIFVAIYVGLLQANDDDLKNIFKQKDIEGTLIITNLDESEYYIHNQSRAKISYSPASTFKIANTLIALNEDIIKKDDIFKWDKKVRKYPQWNKDQTLQEAFKNSCVWCYQEIARQIPKVTYENYLVLFNYGNYRIRRDIENFWLDGALRISALEQIEFLKRLYNFDLPIKKEHISTTMQILLQKESNEYKLSYKTGWDGKIGWIVGYAQNSKDIYFFVLNANIKEEQLKAREDILIEALKIKGIIKADF